MGRRYAGAIAGVLFALLCVAAVFELVELMRRAEGRDEATFVVLVQMALLKLPLLGQKILPFAALFGAMLAVDRLTRGHELTAARAAGVSVWQFLAPAVAIALLLGVFVATVFNPLASATVARYEQLETTYLHGRPSFLDLSSSGLWLRQADTDGQSVIHAREVNQPGLQLGHVTIFQFGEADRFRGRIDARTAVLRHGYWLLTDALLTGPDRLAESMASYRVATPLTAAQIQDSFAAPETMSFWALPKFIETLQSAGFSALRHRLYWHSVLAGPLLLCAMVLLAATSSLRLGRRRRALPLAVIGVLAGFVLYFLSDVALALGLSGSIPPVLAAWTPAGVTTLLGLTMLLHLEDG
ncbi:MAG: LPS export ABC transporter permease LptG [Alphaproteobacteria bacterium]|nr:LPS export ABC transporter permease LptG [Alphaproteobacteria bacterium]